MATAVKKIKRRPKSYFIHAIIGIAVMFCFGLIPAAEPLTPLGMSVIGRRFDEQTILQCADAFEQTFAPTAPKL